MQRIVTGSIAPWAPVAFSPNKEYTVTRGIRMSDGGDVPLGI
jgi:hypothetical protein